MKTKSMKLSSHLLKMKFMRKTAVQEQEELAKEEQINLIDDEHWYLNVEQKKIETNSCSVIIEPSYSVFNGIGFGRMSFNGYNPQIEKLNNAQNEEKAETDSEKEIDDEEMAKYQSSLAKTMSDKFSKTGNNRVLKHKDAKVKRLGQN